MFRPKLLSSLSVALPGFLILASSVVPAEAQYAPGSINTVVRNVDVSFKENDVGALIDTVVQLCNTQNTVMANGPYRRVKNVAASGNVNSPFAGPEPSAGNARFDYVVARVANFGNPAIDIKAGDVLNQIGINLGVSNNTTVLSATVSYNSSTNIISVTDTTPTDSQVLDAGPTVGGVDALMFIKNGTPKTADIVCDMNMWFQGGTQGFTYGVKNFELTTGINTLFAFYAAGPSGAGSTASIAQLCGILNPSGKTPLRNDDGTYKSVSGTTCTSSTLDPSLGCVGSQWIREEHTTGSIGSVIRFFGDPAEPANFTSCALSDNGSITPAAYCDQTEPTPQGSAVSGNSCNPEEGFAGSPSIVIGQGLENNPGGTYSFGGRIFVYQ